MADEGPPDDHYDRLLASLGLPPIGDWPERYRGPDRRQQDRRQQERRELGFKARRHQDRELNLTTRRFLFEYFHQLPPEILWLWFDGLVLGNATHRQLAILVDAVVQREREHRERRAAPRHRGRPPATRLVPMLDPIYNTDIKAMWRLLTEQFKDFSDARRHYHASLKLRDLKQNPPSVRRQRQVEIRERCRHSAIGRRVDAVGLFEELFNNRRITPGALAARLLHRELEYSLASRASQVREKADKTLSPVSREFCLMVAAKTENDRRHLGTWRTFLNKLQRRSPR